jgi:hypothetical protein
MLISQSVLDHLAQRLVVGHARGVGRVFSLAFQ